MANGGFGGFGGGGGIDWGQMLSSFNNPNVQGNIGTKFGQQGATATFTEHPGLQPGAASMFGGKAPQLGGMTAPQTFGTEGAFGVEAMQPGEGGMMDRFGSFMQTDQGKATLAMLANMIGGASGGPMGEMAQGMGQGMLSHLYTKGLADRLGGGGGGNFP